MREHTARQISIGYFIATLLIYAAVIFAMPNPPAMVDYPDWVYQGMLFHGIVAGHPSAGYALKHYPVPNTTTTVALGLLDTVLNWRLAAKVWICVYLLLAGLATWILANQAGSRCWRLFLILPGVIIFNLIFWFGQISFEIGMCLLILFIALLVRGTRMIYLAAFLTLIFFTHMEACAAALLFLGIWVAITKQWNRLLIAAPAAMLTVWYSLARFLGGNVDSGGLESTYRYGSRSFFIYKANTYFKTFGYVNACDLNGQSLTEMIIGHRAYIFLIAASISTALLCIWITGRSIVNKDDDTLRRCLRIYICVLLSLSLFLPQILLGTADPGSRLLLIGVLLVLLVSDLRTMAGTTLAFLSVMFCLVNVWQFYKVNVNPLQTGHVRDLPPSVLKYAHVESASRVNYYFSLDSRKMDQPIFPTGIFRKNPDNVLK